MPAVFNPQAQAPVEAPQMSQAEMMQRMAMAQALQQQQPGPAAGSNYGSQALAKGLQGMLAGGIQANASKPLDITPGSQTYFAADMPAGMRGGQ